MEKTRVISLSSLLLLLLLLSLEGVHAGFRCYDAFFPSNSSYRENRDLLFSSLPSNVIAKRGFHNASLGRDSDRVYVVALCRRGFNPQPCLSCLDKVIQNMKQGCPDRIRAFSWDGDEDEDVSCLVRYTNASTFRKLELRPITESPHPNSIEKSVNLTLFEQEWDSMVNLTIQAASSADNSSVLKYYGATRSEFTEVMNVYALMQCTPDISAGECNQCLRENVAYYKTRYWGRQGGEIARPSCFFRWDLYPFYDAFDNVTRVPAPPRASPPPLVNNGGSVKKGSRNRFKKIAIIVVPTVINVFVFVALVSAYSRRRRTKSYIELNESSDGKFTLRFDLATIKNATDDFSLENKLGQGGFGSVYKGVLPNGQEIAVKRLAGDSGQGNLEFKNEVLILTRLQHRNLVKLFGFCNEGDEELLVYEFVPNSSLDRFIFDPDKRSTLTWDIRYKIIQGIVRGLLYLHEDSQLRIIHRDLKTSNILLDAEMNSKVSDFGMARLFNMDETRGETSRVVGTYGYMAPEYVRNGQFSAKSDVYSFGVVLMEIISGQRNNHFEVEGLPAFAWKKWVEGKAGNVIDPVLRNGPQNETMRFIHIGLLCVQENISKRPTMNSIIQWLGSETTTMPLPTGPAFMVHSLADSDASSSKLLKYGPLNPYNNGEDGTCSSNDATVSELYPR